MKWSEFLAHESWFKANMSPDEPIVFPRRTAKKRAANKEKRRRVIFDVDEQTYSEFHTERERILLVLGDNPSLFGEFLCEVLGSWSDQMLERWVAAREGNQPHSHTCQQCEKVVIADCDCDKPEKNVWCSMTCKAAFDL
jgi:hypothetical protein